MYAKQIMEIVERLKTCTQRVVKPGETAVEQDGQIVAVLTAAGRVKWKVGGVYAVSPTRGWPAAVWREVGSGVFIVKPNTKTAQAEYIGKGYQPVRICIKRIERVSVQAMDEVVAVAEGVQSVAAYMTLWTSINQGRGDRWEDNPVVWRIWFELVG